MLLETVTRAGAANAARPQGMLSVCFVAPHAWPVLSGDARLPIVGGAEVQQAILARLLAAAGHEVSMVCLDYGQPDKAKVDGVTVHKAFSPDAGLPLIRFLHPRLSSMWRALREADADVYYYRSASMWVWLVTEFCRRHGRRAVYAGASDKDFVPDQGGQIRYARDRYLFQRGLAQVDRIVAQNDHQRATCRETYGRHAVVIPSCYELPTESGGSARDCVLWVGTLHVNKRPEILLELAARLRERRFVMIGGPGPDPGFYERIRAAAAAVPNVEFKGFLPLAEVEPWFDRAAVLVNTSLYEGMPNTFLQAWARGVPTVATVDVGVAVHRTCPDLDTLAAGVQEAFRNPGLGAACREYFERSHSSRHVLERYQGLLMELAR